MDEYIKLDDAIRGFRMRFDGRMNGKQFAELCMQTYVEYLKSLPTVEIVRCRECRWWESKYGLDIGYCRAYKRGFILSGWDVNYFYRARRGDFFCADGERRTDNG